jgi:hypothetical protein
MVRFALFNLVKECQVSTETKAMGKNVCNALRGKARTSRFARVVVLALAGAAGALSAHAALPA